jgi:hypothetical protein
VADAKRLSPKKVTIRELFGKCGNRCAFPSCTHEIINAEGVFVAEICHIEAAETGGPRFNEQQSNEARRHVSNLMLMCHKHHKITDDKEHYPTPKLQAMKRKHEQWFLDATNKIWASIEDHTDSDEISLPKKLIRFYKSYGIEREHWKGVRRAITRLAKKLKRVPTPSREMLYHAVRRLSELERVSGLCVMVAELAQACNMRTRNVWNIVHILINHELAYVDDDYHGIFFLRHVGDVDEFDIWPALRGYCKEYRVDLKEILVNLRFDLLNG